MKRLIRYTPFIFWLLAFIPVLAQDSSALKKWNISECFQYAAAHNIEINTLRLNEESRVQDLSAARGAKIPGLSGSVSNTLYHGNNTVSANGGSVNQLSGSGSYSVNASVLLWNDNYVNNHIRQNELLVSSAELYVAQSLNNITLRITQAYLDILLTKETEKYVADLVNTTEALVKQAQMLYDKGSIARVGLLQLQAQLAGDRYLLIQTQNALQQNILSLKQILQLPANTLFDIAVPVSTEPVMFIEPLETVQEAAKQNFPEMKIGKLALDIAELDILKARAAFLPVLRANGSMGTGFSTVLTNSVSSKETILNQTGNRFYQQAGVTLSVPIFSNRMNKTNLEKAKIGYRQANLNQQNTELVLTQAVERVYLDAVNALHAYEAAGVQLRAATESYRIVNEQYKLGAVSTYNLFQERTRYVQSLQAYTQAKYTAVLQQKIYEFYLGKPVEL